MEYQTITNHIMWQPTASCKLSCPGCYVPKMKIESASVNAQIALDVFSTRKVICQQFTLSMDDLLNFPKDLKEIVRGIWAKYPDSSLPELCVTANSWNTVQCWARDLEMSVDQFLKPISILSLSTFPSLGKNISFMIEQCHANDTKVNFNYVVRGGEETNKAFEMGVRYADQVYLVFKKAPLGEEQCAESFSNWLKARKIVQQTAQKKLIEDACILDSIHKKHTGCKCGAWKQKVHVWPNGDTTGCPYDTHQTKGSMDNCKIIDVIHTMQESGN